MTDIFGDVFLMLLPYHINQIDMQASSENNQQVVNKLFSSIYDSMI